MGLETQTEFGGAKQMITADEDFSLPESEALVKVNLACGQTKREGFLGVDKVKTEDTDLVHDLLEFPWPFEDNSVYEFNCEHFVEHIPVHLPNGEYGFIKFMEEVWRCLMDGGTIHITAPYYTSIRAWQDPTHTRAITDVTFHYFSKDHARQMNMDHYTGNCNFEILTVRHFLLPEYEAYADEARKYATQHYFNVVADIEFILRKKPLE